MAILEYPTSRDGFWTKRAEGPPTAEYVGRVIFVTTREERVMSDVYANVTRADVVTDNGEIKSVSVKAHFECDTRDRVAEVDWNPEAEPEVAAKLEAFREAARKRAEEYKARKAAEAEEREKCTPRKGKRMTVVRGRKVPQGITGTVFWVGRGRVGLDVTGKKDSRGWAVDPVWVRDDYLREVED